MTKNKITLKELMINDKGELRIKRDKRVVLGKPLGPPRIYSAETLGKPLAIPGIYSSTLEQPLTREMFKVLQGSSYPHVPAEANAYVRWHYRYDYPEFADWAFQFYKINERKI